MRLKKVENKEQILLVEKLAKEVWEQHYTPIIGETQVAYMLENFQSKDVMAAQINQGYLYYIIQSEMEVVGYLSILPKNKELFLSKIYVLQRYQGKGYGKFTMDFVVETAKFLGKQKISLTVNKDNSNSIKAYEKMGFKNMDAVVTDIGSGYVMDDYIMEMKLF